MATDRVEKTESVFRRFLGSQYVIGSVVVTITLSIFGNFASLKQGQAVANEKLTNIQQNTSMGFISLQEQLSKVEEENKEQDSKITELEKSLEFYKGRGDIGVSP